METMDSIKIGDKVTVTIWGPGNSSLYKFSGTGFHSLETAIAAAISEANLEINPEDCVFEVTNDTTEVTHRYRLNAHGNLKLII